MMTNPTEVHEQIAANIGAPLKLAMDARGCRTYQGGMRVQRSDDPRDTDKTRPDVVVRCGAIGTKTYIADPLVVIEVLSPSLGSDPAGLTPGSDAGCGMGSDPQGLTPAKLDFYKSLPTLRHIALVYQDQMRVEHYRRGEQGFDLDVLKLPDDVLHLEAVEFRIDLTRIYFDVTL